MKTNLDLLIQSVQTSKLLHGHFRVSTSHRPGQIHRLSGRQCSGRPHPVVRLGRGCPECGPRADVNNGFGCGGRWCQVRLVAHI